MGTPSRLLIGSLKTTARRVLHIKRPHLLVACMPKSASTFLTGVLAELPGMRRAPLAWSFERREQVLDEIQLARYDLDAYVCQQHLRYSSHVGKAIKEYGLTPVVLTRNIFDIVASIRDHTRNESSHSPMVAIGPEHAKLPDSALEELIAELAIPWFINFYVSWQNVDCLRLDYERLRSSVAEVVREICGRAEMKVDDHAIAAAIEEAQGKAHRFNKGVSGRGKNISPKARETILSLARHYPNVDFSPIGIARADTI
ncbi:MAG: hypothetical protein WA384_15505, partial [Rhodomicrobium sp.]